MDPTTVAEHEQEIARLEREFESLIGEMRALLRDDVPTFV